MGVYDTLIDGNKSCQVKMFECELRTYYRGDKIRGLNRESFVIIFPEYEGVKYALILAGRFEGLTDELIEDYEALPKFSKWGQEMFDNVLENPYKTMVENLVKGDK